MIHNDTICAISTAQGGAIGVIRVSGPIAIEAVSRIFAPIGGKPLKERRNFSLTFGKIFSDGEKLLMRYWSPFSAHPIPIRVRILWRFLAMAPLTFFSAYSNC